MRGGPSTVTVLPLREGLAVLTHDVAGEDGAARVVPWNVAAELLADPQLTVQTAAVGDCSGWDSERLLAGLAALDPEALRLIGHYEPPARTAVQQLGRQTPRWRRLLDIEVLSGDLAAACCRAGLPLPGDDPLATLRLIALLFRRAAGQVAVRERLHRDHPWLGSGAWLATTGQLAERIVLEGRRREDLRAVVQPGECTIAELLGEPARFACTRSDVRAAVEAILSGTARWDERGHLSVETAMDYHFPIGGGELTCSIGGMHSQDAPGAIAGPLVDLDVASYYPSLIARDGIAPPQLPEFPARTRVLLERRLVAKRAGDGIASNAMKYVINSLYGQLGNSRSGLFAPAEALRVVLTGQLHLLQLIDGALAAGCELISANTDGIVVRGNPSAAATAWEARTGLTLERTPYRQMWRTSVNDYLAVAPDGTLAKAKGRFGGGDEGETTRRAAAPVIARAVVEHLLHGRGLAEVVAGSRAVTDFTLWRRARGLRWDEQEIGDGVVRWVVGNSGRPLIQSTSQRETATLSRSAVLVPDPAALDPALINREWYVREARELLDQVEGTRHGARQLSWLDSP